MVVLDGNAYDAKCLEMGAERDGELDSCALLLNNKQAPLLAAGPSATYTDHHRVIVQLAVRPPDGFGCIPRSLIHSGVAPQIN